MHHNDHDMMRVQDLWNATTIGDYWRLWNMPVHKWLLRHVYVSKRRDDHNMMRAQDWWNATTIGDYWRLWNMPVHRWLLRHVFTPMGVPQC